MVSRILERRCQNAQLQKAENVSEQETTKGNVRTKDVVTENSVNRLRQNENTGEGNQGA